MMIRNTSLLALFIAFLTASNVLAGPTEQIDEFERSSRALQSILREKPFDGVVRMVRAIENGCLELSKCHIPPACKKRVENIQQELVDIGSDCINKIVIGGRTIFHGFEENINYSIESISEITELVNMLDSQGIKSVPFQQQSEILDLIDIMDSEVRVFKTKVIQNKQDTESVIYRILKAKDKAIELAEASTKELEQEREKIIKDGNDHFYYLTPSPRSVLEMWEFYKDNAEKRIDIIFDCLTYKIVFRDQKERKSPLIWNTCRAEGTYTVKGSETVYCLPLADKQKSEQMYDTRLSDTLQVIKANLDRGLDQLKVVYNFLDHYQNRLEELRMNEHLGNLGNTSKAASLARLNQMKKVLLNIQRATIAYLTSNNERI